MVEPRKSRAALAPACTPVCAHIVIEILQDGLFDLLLPLFDRVNARRGSRVP